MIRTIKIAGWMLALVAATACTNIFENFADTDSDKALFISARIYNDNQDYTSALAEFAKMSPSYKSRRDVLALWAASYAGRAGLDFVTFAENVQNIGSTNLMLFLMQNFDQGTAAKIADFKAAHDKMLQISTTMSDLTNDELLELAMIELGYMGTTVSTYDDLAHDGTPDGLVCTGFPAWVPATPDPISQFVVSINYLSSAITQLSTNGLSFGPSAMTGAQAACTFLTANGFASYAFCGITDASTVTNNQYKGVLSLINEGSAGIGLGNPCAGDIATCACP